ncbi:MAG: protein kinase [Calditrichaeota bacterium]|nr:protein kinase [Calditrichota bacterium]
MPILLGDNKILSAVNIESFWRIMKAESVSSGKQAWFSILSRHYAKNQELVSLFLNAAKRSALLSHPRILKTIRYGEENDTSYILMKAFSGVPLTRLLGKDKQFLEDEAVKIVLQVCQALQYANLTGVMHGALTPESIYIDKEKDVALINFGTGEFIDYALFELKDTKALGYASYFSPQRIHSKSVAESGNDLYSLGVIFYYMLSGELPFSGTTLDEICADKEGLVPSPRSLNTRISPKVENIIMRMIDPNPVKRFHSMSQFIRELAPESVAEETLPQDIEPGHAGIHGVLGRLIDRLPVFSHVFSPTLVGSKRRVAYFLLTLSLVLIAIISVFLISEIGRQKHTEKALLGNYATEAKVPDTSGLSSGNEEQGRADSTALSPAGLTLNDSVKGQQSAPEAVVGNKPSAGTSSGRSNESQILKTSSTSALNSTATRYSLVITTMAHSLPVQAQVYIDKKLKGSTASDGTMIIHEMAAGSFFHLRVEKKGYKTWARRVRIQSKEPNFVNITLEARKASLRRITIAKVDFADRVMIDGRLPALDLPCNVDLALGPHRLRFVDSKSSFFWEKTIILNPNSNKVIRVDSAELGAGVLSVVLSNALRYGYAFVVVDNNEANKKTTPFRIPLRAGRHRLRILRDGYRASPRDTVVVVFPHEETSINCRIWLE